MCHAELVEAWGLSRRPGHLSTCEHVHVHVLDGLTSGLAGVDDQTKTFAAVVTTEASGDVEELSDRGRFCRAGEIDDICCVLDRDDQQMHRRLRTEIVKRHDFLVAIGDTRRNIAGNDLAENTIGLHGYVLGLRYSNEMCVSGLGTKPAIELLSTIGTSTWTIVMTGT